VTLAGPARGAARRLLGWALDDLPGGTAGGSSPQDVMAALWKRDTAAPAPVVRRAAAALASWGEHPEGAAAILEAALPATTDVERRAVEWALTVAYRRVGRFEDLARVADALLAADPGSRQALTRKVVALERLGRRDEVERLAAGALASSPDDPFVLSLLASARLALGDLAGAGKAYRQLVDGGKATPSDFNNAAWLLLFNDEPVGDTAVDWARRAVEGTGRRGYASLNTLAAVLAAAGRPAEAREVFLQALDAKETEGLDGADWVVQGLIAEKYGLTAAARSAFARVKDGPEDDGDDPTRPSAYARQRLAKLGAKQ